jgi:transketolase
MDNDLKKQIKKIANTIRQLSMEAIQKAHSGHPGMPLGCAEIGAYLYGIALRHNPENTTWLNRDRFILSAGHGSMFLYSCLHLSGFDLSLEQIKLFRQLHSHTPGHPEYGETPGVELTTGPLGQGIGNAVGMALAYKILAAKFNTEDFPLFDNKIFALAGDGCMMEGIASEVSSLSGHLKLNNLILIYDANNVTLDGALSESMSEDTKTRYRSYGWEVYEIDGHDLDAIHAVINELRQKQERPALIVAHTVIGKGSPNSAGSSKVHGSPLGEEEVVAAKEAMGLPEEKFYVAQSVRDFFASKLEKQKKEEEKWDIKFKKWAESYPDLANEFETMLIKNLPDNLEEILCKIEINDPMSGRGASHKVINYLAEIFPFLYAGSADLSTSDKTFFKNFSFISSNNFKGRNIKYGDREFAMATISNGLYLSQMILPISGTFLVFSDYMRNAIRLAALSSYRVIYQLTHDSIFIGEDGPTHQPVEQIASLRAIHNLQVIRPADSWEVKMAWLAALEHNGPTVIALSRQNLVDIPQIHVPYKDGMGKGAYIVKKEKEKADFTLFATGSELSLAFEVSTRLEQLGKSVRVVSFPCWELFDRQSNEYKESVVGGDIGKRVSIEAGSDFGWHKYIGRDGISICVESFGISAPAAEIAIEFGFTPDAILQHILA